MTKRIFIAINLPTDVKTELGNLGRKLQRFYNEQKGIKWTAPELMHITLHFLGNLRDEQIQKVKHGIDKTVSGYSKMKLKLNNFNCFPNEQRPRVIFIDAKEIDGSGILNLRSNLGEMLKKLGLAVDERPWHTHITLGRVKFGKINLEHIKKIAVPEIEWEIENVDLMTSELAPGGPRYTVLKSYPLKNLKT